MSQIRQIRKKQIILYRGEATPHIFEVKKGIVRAYSALRNGTEANIALFGPGDHFPQHYDPSATPHSLFFYEAMTDCEIEDLTAEEAQIRLETVTNSERRYVGALLHIDALVQTNASDRVGYTLRYLVLRFGEPLSGGKFTRIIVKLTQQDVAALASVSRETANAELSKLKKDEIIIEKNKYYSVNLKRLLDSLEEDSDLEINLG